MKSGNYLKELNHRVTGTGKLSGQSREGTINMVALHMGVEEMGCEQGTRVIQSASKSGVETGMCAENCRAIKH